MMIKIKSTYLRILNKLKVHTVSMFLYILCLKFGCHNKEKTKVIIDLKGSKSVGSMIYLVNCLMLNNDSVFEVRHYRSMFEIYQVLGMKETIKRVTTLCKICGYKSYPDSYLIYDHKLDSTDNTVNKKFYLDYDYFNLEKIFDMVMMPYFASPGYYLNRKRIISKKYNSSLQLNKNRRLRVFFAGSVNANYMHLDKRFNMMTRLEVIDLIRSFNLEKCVLVNSKHSLLEAIKEEPKVLLALSTDRNKPLLNLDEYFYILDHSDFFLCAPGFIMPHSHNCIEAMSKGVIPILSYSEYFSIPLQDKINCIYYNTKENLKTKLESIVLLSEEEIDCMRKNVIDYYNQYLSPESFSKVIYESKGDLNILTNSETYSVSLLKK